MLRQHVALLRFGPPDTDAQTFGATLRVYGLGARLLDSRNVFFAVPPA